MERPQGCSACTHHERAHTRMQMKQSVWRTMSGRRRCQQELRKDKTPSWPRLHDPLPLESAVYRGFPYISPS